MPSVLATVENVLPYGRMRSWRKSVHLWERHKGESLKAFTAFAQYRDLGEERSLTVVAQQLHKSRPLMGRWSRRWKWVDRVEAYDRELDRKRLKEIQKARRAMLDKHASVASGLLGTVITRLNQMIEENEIVKMSPAEMARVTEVASKVERLARGLPSEKVEHDGEVRQTHDIDRRILSDPIARQLALELFERLASEA